MVALMEVSTYTKFHCTSTFLSKVIWGGGGGGGGDAYAESAPPPIPEKFKKAHPE